MSRPAIDWRRLAEKGYDLVHLPGRGLCLRIRGVSVMGRQGRPLWMWGAEVPSDLAQWLWPDEEGMD